MRPVPSKSYAGKAFSHSPPCAYSGAGSSAAEKYGTSASYSDWRRCVCDSSGPSGFDGPRFRPCQAAAAIRLMTASSGPYGTSATTRTTEATRKSSGPRLSLGASAHLRRPAEASRRRPRVMVISGWRTSVALSAAVRASSRLRAICALPVLRMRGRGRRATAVSWRCVRTGGAASELDAAEEARQALAAGLDARGDGGAGQVEAEQRRDQGVRGLEPVLAEEDEDDDAEQYDAGDGEDHLVLLVRGDSHHEYFQDHSMYPYDKRCKWLNFLGFHLVGRVMVILTSGTSGHEPREPVPWRFT